MPNATVRANARGLPEATNCQAAKSESASDAAIQKRVCERYFRPGTYEYGVELLARMESQNAVAKALDAEFEAAWKREDAIARDDTKSDEEMGAAVEFSDEIARRILALSGADHLPTIRLKASVYLWAQSESVESLSQKATVTAHRALVSLLRDLGADRPATQLIEEAAQ